MVTKRATPAPDVTADDERAAVRRLISHGLLVESLTVELAEGPGGRQVLQGSPDLPAALEMAAMLAEQVGVRHYTAGPGALVMRRQARRARKQAVRAECAPGEARHG